MLMYVTGTLWMFTVREDIMLASAKTWMVLRINVVYDCVDRAS